MVELPQAWEPIVQALVEAPVAWQTPAQLAAVLGRDAEETTDLLCLMDVAGWIDVWEIEPGPCVILSPLAAERLHVRLVEVGPDETPRWSRVGEPTPAPPRARHVCRQAEAATLDALIDPRPSPDVESERSEAAEARAGRPDGPSAPEGRREDVPTPTLLIGQRLSPWPGPARLRRTPCPACAGRALRPHEYCLGCDRWGLDTSVPTVEPARGGRRGRRRSTGPVLSPEERAARERIQAERERERRKARRKARRRAKAEAERTLAAGRRRNAGTGVLEGTHDAGSRPASDRAAR